MEKTAAFLQCKTTMDPAGRVSTSQLYAAYSAWVPTCESAGGADRRRTFTAHVRGLFAPWPNVTYGVHEIDGRVSRGFKGLRLAVEDDGAHNAQDAPQLQAAQHLTDAAAKSRATDPLLVADLRTVRDLMVTAATSSWSRTVARELLDEYADQYPELNAIKSLV